MFRISGSINFWDSSWVLQYRRSIRMIHSGLLYRLDISTFRFYEPLLFQIFFPWKFINIYSFPCLPSLLQPTAKQITISINIFICFKYYTAWNQFFIKIHVKVCYIQVWFKREIPPLNFVIKGMVYRLL